MTPFQNVQHHVTRFFGVIVSSPLSPAEQSDVNEVLSESQAGLFWEQDPVDQRHAYEVAKRVRDKLGERSDAIAAALLHDIGKRHTSAGPIGRSLATVLDVVRLPMPADWRRYRHHGELGAADLEQIGADRLSVAFAQGRHAAGDLIEPEIWAALVEADNA